MATQTKAEIGIIGGSGLYQMSTLKNTRTHSIDTPYGLPSGDIITGEIDGVTVAFLARHGENHSLLPSEIPYRANIYALKKLGIKYLVSFSAVGSLNENMHPRDMVIPDQYIDLSKQRAATFFGEGLIAHVSMAEPTCPQLNQLLEKAVNSIDAGIKVHQGGTYICIEGPQFSSLAESNWYRAMGANIIGMTNMPEAKLAKEAQIAYTSLTMVTDFDCWHPKEDNVNADDAIANLIHNAQHAQFIAKNMINLLKENAPKSDSHHALSHAVVSDIEGLNVNKRELIDLLLE